MAYDDTKVQELTARAIDQGFKAFKLKVGSADAKPRLAPSCHAAQHIGDAGILSLMPTSTESTSRVSSCA